MCSAIRWDKYVHKSVLAISQNKLGNISQGPIWCIATVKGTVHAKIKMTFFPLACRALQYESTKLHKSCVAPSTKKYI